ncbi:hypothetical protein AGMMS49975_08460 [Clostridia bacterium]|nr:hypothetical protein AGMMS49975_08460 [Clostridia bacterium]
MRAMETAGAEGFSNRAESTGLGTPATRAGVIEKLIKRGFVERQKKQLVPTQKGMNLAQLLPDNIKSPFLTAEWEQKLKQVEYGELAASDFMEGIKDLANELVAANSAPLPEMVRLFDSLPNEGNKGINHASKGETGGKLIGKCPRCGSNVAESSKGFFCSNQDCK